jgi:O-antigen/teichoic acid export membrane protein
MSRSTAGAEARRFGRSAGILSAGVGTAGLLTYAYFSLASHNLDPDSYGELVVLWSVVFVSISVLYRPVEQLLSRTIAERRARDLEVGSALRTAAVIQIAVATASALVILALHEPLRDSLLSGSQELYWVMFGAVIAFGASFYARGFLAGNRRFVLLAALLISESASRAAFALAVALGITSGQSAIALGIVAAPCFSLVVVPLAFGRRAAGAPSPGSARAVSLAASGGFATAVLLVMLSEQTLLNAGPLLVRAFDGAAAAGFVFNVLMVARAPLLVFQGVATSLLPHLTRLLSGAGRDPKAFRHSVRMTLRAIAGFTALVVAIVVAVGPELMQIAFSDRFSYDRAGLLIVAVGMGLYLVATTLNQAALAEGRARAAALCWVGCAAGFLAWGLLPVLDAARRVEIGFAGAALALALALAALYRRPGPARGLEPGSVEELSARLATADEAS